MACRAAAGRPQNGCQATPRPCASRHALRLAPGRTHARLACTRSWVRARPPPDAREPAWPRARGRAFQRACCGKSLISSSASKCASLASGAGPTPGTPHCAASAAARAAPAAAVVAPGAMPACARRPAHVGTCTARSPLMHLLHPWSRIAIESARGSRRRGRARIHAPGRTQLQAWLSSAHSSRLCASSAGPLHADPNLQPVAAAQRRTKGLGYRIYGGVGVRV